jgi:hypothetical protein
MYGIVVLVHGMLILSAPLAVLLDRFIPDDAFYYYNTARYFSQTGYSTFDGIHFTNGYQPLWFLLSLPIFRLFPEGGELPLRFMLLIQLALSLFSTIVFVRSIAKLFGVLPAAFSAILWVVVFQRTMLNGLETSLQMFLYAFLFHRFGLRRMNPNGLGAPYEYLALGVLSGLVFLARLDMGFAVAAIAIYEIIDIGRSRAPRTNKVICISLLVIPLGLISGSYLLMNLVSTGHLMPVSGAAKQFYSEVARQRAIQGANDPWRVYIQNLIWPVFSRTHNFIVIGVLGPYLLMALSYIPALSPTLSQVRRFWPFYVGATLSYLFYALVYYGGHTRTFWYYGPHAFLAFLTLAGAARAVDLLLPFRWVLGLSSVLLIGLALGWIDPIETALAIVLGILAALIGRIVRLRSELARRIGLGIAAAGLLGVLVVRSINLQTWLIVVLGTVYLGVVICGDKVSRMRAGFSVGMVLIASIAVHLTNVVSDLKAAPGNWNFNLYQGALWAREHLPDSAIIWSGNAGILGYFSGHRVVNTDGLANDYYFLENILEQGRLAEYYRKWDYYIDAFPVSSDWTIVMPDGCYVPLPPELGEHQFNDGSNMRQLGVFQVQSDGVVLCDTRE